MAVAEPKKRGRPPLGGPERTTLVNLKGSLEYKAWLDEVSERTRIPIATIIRDGLAEWAARRDLPAPPANEGRRKGGG